MIYMFTCLVGGSPAPKLAGSQHWDVVAERATCYPLHARCAQRLLALYASRCGEESFFESLHADVTSAHLMEENNGIR